MKHAEILGTLDGVADVDPPLHQIQLPPDPGDLMFEVDLIAEDLTCSWVSSQGVEGTVDHAGRGLFVVEDAEGRHGDDGNEDW